MSALGPGLLQLSYLWASCVSPYLKVFLSSCLSRAEVLGGLCWSLLYWKSSPTPIPTRRHYSTFPEPLSQSPTGFAHRLSPSSTPYWTLLQSALFSVYPVFPKPCLSFSSCSIPAPGPICSSTSDQEIPNLQISHTPQNLTVPRPADQACRCGAHTSWPHHSVSGTSNPPPPTATSVCSPRAAPHPQIVH